MKSGLAPTKYPVGTEQSSHPDLCFCGGKNWGKLVQVAFYLARLDTTGHKEYNIMAMRVFPCVLKVLKMYYVVSLRQPLLEGFVKLLDP